MFWIGLVVWLILSYLGVGHVRRWVSQTFGWEAERWFDILKYIFIPVALGISIYVHNENQNARELAEHSLEKANEKIEALNPHAKPIMTANCHVVVEYESSWKFPDNNPIQFVDPNGIIRFVDNDARVLLALVISSLISKPLRKGAVISINEFSLSSSSAFSKNTANDLRKVQSINIRTDSVKGLKNIFGGNLSCSINSVVPVEFTIPAQTANEQGIFHITGPEVSKAFEGFK